jgi:TRAP transporter TAXI family solute receptor
MMKALFAALAVAALGFAYKYANPAPPHTLVRATGDGEGDYQTYAKMYRDIIKQDGVDVVLRPTQGASENLKLLQDPKSGVDAGFAEDGLGSVDDQPDVSSLGSLYYEPLWIFTRAGEKVRKLSELAGKRVSLGEKGSGIQPIVADMLKASGIDEKTAKIVRLSPAEAADSLRRGKVDAIFLR